LRDEDHFGRILRSEGIDVHALDIGSGRNVIAGIATLTRLIRRERPAIVHTWLYHADLLGGAAARLAGVRAIIWGVRNNNLEASAISRSTRRVASIAARLAGHIPQVIVSNSVQASRNHIDFGYQAARFRVIANGYDVDQFRPDARLREATRASLGIAPDELLVGTVARWDPQKDHANLLAALQLVAPRRSKVRILLVGSQMHETNECLRSLIQASSLTERVILAGPRDDVPAIMNALDLHVLSSLGEAFPNVVAEAMACGTPCVVTDVGDAARIVNDTGWVVPARDSDALAAAVEDALSALERQSREALGLRCRSRIVQHFGMSQMVEAYTALWHELEHNGS
jgi:glycosyltransferase involved in cell wall biosynthesis